MTCHSEISLFCIHKACKEWPHIECRQTYKVFHLLPNGPNWIWYLSLDHLSKLYLFHRSLTVLTHNIFLSLVLPVCQIPLNNVPSIDLLGNMLLQRPSDLTLHHYMHISWLTLWWILTLKYTAFIPAIFNHLTTFYTVAVCLSSLKPLPSVFFILLFFLLFTSLFLSPSLCW